MAERGSLRHGFELERRDVMATLGVSLSTQSERRRGEEDESLSGSGRRGGSVGVAFTEESRIEWNRKVGRVEGGFVDGTTRTDSTKEETDDRPRE